MDNLDLNEHRLIRLERSNRHLRAGLISVVILGAVICLVGADAPTPRVIRASSFVLVDSAGRERAELSNNGKSVGLQLLNQDGTRAVVIAAAKDVNGMFISDAAGQARTSLTVTATGEDLAFLRPASPRETFLITDNTAGTGIAIRDAAGHEMVDVGLSDKGPGVAITDGNGTPRAVMALEGFISSDKGGHLLWASAGENLTPEERKQAEDLINQLPQ